jgi:hypothetical protein
MKFDDIALGYLSFVNKDNKERRLDLFKESLRHLSGMKGSCKLISFDNNSCDEVKNDLIDFGFDLNFHFNENFYDLSVLYGTYYVCKKLNCKYMIYAYDDICYLQNDFIGDSINFLNLNLDVDCVRICSYEKGNTDFHAEKVGKLNNPDAINHWASHKNNVPHINVPLTWDPSQTVGDNTFHINDWHYTSRSSVFRVSSFEKFLTGHNELPVLNFFEGHVYKKNKEFGIKTGILEGGAFKTMAQHSTKNSERLNLGNNFLRHVKIKVKNIEKAIDDIWSNYE